MENHLDLTDTETNKKYLIAPTKIAQTLGKIATAKKYIQEGNYNAAIQFLENAEKTADCIMFERVYNPKYEDTNSGLWNDELLTPVDYNSFYIDGGPEEI